MSAETVPLLLKTNLKQLKLPTMLAEWETLGGDFIRLLLPWPCFAAFSWVRRSWAGTVGV